MKRSKKHSKASDRKISLGAESIVSEMPILRAMLICLQLQEVCRLLHGCPLRGAYGTSIAALRSMSENIERWVLTAGLEATVADSLRRVLEDQGPEFNYHLEIFELNGSLLEQYYEFAANPAHEWVCLLGRGESADLFVRDYYSFLDVRPPHTLVLLSPSVTAFHLNKLSCPYLIIHGECDPLLKTLPHSAFDQAVYHHQMRYGDPTTDFVAPSDDRYLTVQREVGKELDPLVIRQIVEWLSLTPELGTSKEGIHARGFRAHPTQIKKAS